MLRHPASCDGLIDIRARDGLETPLSRAFPLFGTYPILPLSGSSGSASNTAFQSIRIVP